MKKKHFGLSRLLLLLGIIISCSLPALGQSKSISGIVSDQKGEPIPGVSVLEKGTTNGTITDINGNYNITVSDASTIVFSFIGMKSQEVVVGTQKNIDVVLEDETIGMDEVVVVGYGSQKKANLTGAVSAVDFSDVEGRPASNTATLLQGQMTGVTVSNFANQPGQDNPDIIIRGVGTLNSGTEPLVIVDGVESSMSQIPASDIESVSVLKDAASAAIYGVRAANGVILVTTKRGKEGKPTIQINQSFAWQKAIVEPDLVNSWDQATIINLDNSEKGLGPEFTDAQIKSMKEEDNLDEWANTNWFDEMFRVAPMNNTYLSVSGSKDNVRYMVSTDILNQDGIMINTGLKRYNFRSNLDVDISKRIKIGMNLAGNKREVTETINSASATDDDQDLNYIIRRFASPTVPVKYSNGDWGAVDGRQYQPGGGPNAIKNPVMLAGLGQNKTDEYNFTGKVYADLELVKNLHYKPSYSYVYVSRRQSKYTPRWEMYDKDGSVVNSNENNKLLNKHVDRRRYQVDNILTYDLNVSDHKIGFLAGQSAQYWRVDRVEASIRDFANDEIYQLDAGATEKDVKGSADDLALNSYFGRLNYNYADKYLFEFNYRYDGTSRMPSDSRWGGFPSVSAGWVVSNEGFMSNIEALSFLKLRGSWGQLGNQNLGDDYYPYTQYIETGKNYLWDDGIAPGVAMTELANPMIAWETTTITDFGVDFNLFNNKVQVVADWFNKTSTDVLMRLNLPSTIGVTKFPFQNVGEVKNVGWELGVKVFEKIGAVDVYGGVNLSQVKNEIVDFKDVPDIDNDTHTISMEGEAIDSYYAFIADGYYQTQEELDNAPVQPGNPLRLGDIKLRDISGPDGVPDGQVDETYDRTVIGNPFPDLQYSFNLGAAYKGFDIYAFFQGLQGVDRYYWMNAETNGTFTSEALDYWTPENRDAAVPRWGNLEANKVYSSFYLRDASYLRLKNLEIGYTLPSSITQKAHIQKARFYFSGVNLLTWTHDNVKNYDPEKKTGDDRNRDYPGAKVYSIGVNITL
ncbi:TonB-dependent receptor [Labilibacter sediminis]|nr:TonB-dependent receptor [Labilibacter sediminis]